MLLPISKQCHQSFLILAIPQGNCSELTPTFVRSCFLNNISNVLNQTSKPSRYLNMGKGMITVLEENLTLFFLFPLAEKVEKISFSGYCFNFFEYSKWFSFGI